MRKFYCPSNYPSSECPLPNQLSTYTRCCKTGGGCCKGRRETLCKWPILPMEYNYCPQPKDPDHFGLCCYRTVKLPDGTSYAQPSCCPNTIPIWFYILVAFEKR
ncbi:hypothetical protein SNEBB_001635 [Seison nebaliae]|nr:hypothetical protein SNEBB_001635 [Seison nebaliae]